jgi:hypothetical protein
MNLFDLKNFSINTDHTYSNVNKNNIINTFGDLNEIVNTLCMCFKQKRTCVLTDNTINNFKMKGDIIIIYKYKIYNLTWGQLCIINSFFYDKYDINRYFKITPCIFNIFMLRLVDAHFKYISNTGIALIAPHNAIFGIYNSYEDIVTKCDHYLYFSFNIFSFILYRAHATSNHIVGKLFPTIGITDDYIILNNTRYKLPKSFIKINSTIHGIRKRKVVFTIQPVKKIYTSPLNNSIGEYYTKSLVQNTYIIRLKTPITESRLQDLYKFILLTYPFLAHDNNAAIYNPPTFDTVPCIFGLYIKTVNNDYQTLVVQLNNRYGQYISKIMSKIGYFLKKITTSSNIEVCPHILTTSYSDELIHIVSELYYFITCILFHIPKTIYHLNPKCFEPYKHANYVFSSKEVHLLFDNKNSLFTSNIDYLQSVFIKTLSINMFNSYCILRTNSKINIVPIKQDMSSKNILTFLERGTKAELCKTFLWSVMRHISDNVENSHTELPYIFINIDTVIENCIDSTSKIYTTNSNLDVPIFINVLFNNNSLHISISYKEKHVLFKEAFDHIINQLVR